MPSLIQNKKAIRTLIRCSVVRGLHSSWYKHSFSVESSMEWVLDGRNGFLIWLDSQRSQIWCHFRMKIAYSHILDLRCSRSLHAQACKHYSEKRALHKSISLRRMSGLLLVHASMQRVVWIFHFMLLKCFQRVILFSQKNVPSILIH